MKTSRISFLVLFAVLSLASSLSAAPTDLRVLIDIDGSAGTGCRVITSLGNVDGVDAVVTTSYDAAADGNLFVTGISKQLCANPGSTTFSAPQSISSGGWPVLLDTTTGLLTVETKIPFTSFTTGFKPQLKLGFIATQGSLVDTILTNSGGAPIMFPAPPVPRRRAVGPSGSRIITLDGKAIDWSGLSPIATGEATTGGPGLRVLGGIIGYATDEALFFNFGIQANRNAPVANDDGYTALRGKTFFENAPGVLTNDFDPNHKPLTAILVSGPEHGTLTLNPNGSFTYTNDGSNAPSDGFRYKVNNGSADSNVGHVVFEVVDNRPPQAQDDAYNVAHAGTLNVPLPGVLINDFDPDNDALRPEMVNPPTHGSVTLNTDGSLTYTHDGTNTLTDAFTYHDFDPYFTSNLATVTITVGPDAPPVANNDAYTLAEGATLGVSASTGIFANDTDVDTPKSSFVATVTQAPAHGTLTVNATTGAFIYVHDGSETTTDSFKYTVSDGIATSAAATVNLTITPVNDPPTASNGSATTNEDTPVNISITTSDAEGDTLTFHVISGPQHGTLTGTGPFTYTPAANYNGSDSFVVVADDGKAQSAPATITITITAVDDAPVAAADSYAAAPDGTLHVGSATGMLANDSDPDGDALTASLVSTTANGSLTLNPDGSFDFAANPGFSGIATFTYKAVESIPAALASAVTTVSINVHAVNQAPVANPQTVNTNEDTPASITLTGSDPDGDALSFGIQTLPSHGTLTGSGANRTYTPAANYNGPDSFVFTVSDGTAIATATVTINVAAINDAPVATGDAYATLQNTALNVAAPGVLSNDSDVDGNPLTAVLDTNVSHGTLTLNANGSFSYTPTAGFNGTDSFTYHARDGVANSNVVTVQIGVKANNTAPVAQSQNVTTAEDTQKVIVLTGSDADNDPLAYSVTVQPAHGTLSGSAPNLVYTPAANYNGPDSFSFTVSDGLATSAAATVSITVSAVNDAPVASDDVYNAIEETTLNVPAPGVLGNDSDVDNGSLTAVLGTTTGNGTLTLNANGSFTYTPAANFTGIDGFTYKVSDGSLQSPLAHVSITVSALNDPPVNTVPAAQTLLEDGTLTFSSGNANAISVSDTDANGASEQVTLTATNGTVTLGSTAGITINGGANGSPTVTFTGTISALNTALNGTVYAPNADYNGAATATITTSDLGNSGSGGIQTDTDVVNLTVTSVNDVPSFTSGGAVTVNEDAGPQTISWATGVSAGPANESGQTLTFQITGNTNPFFAVPPAVDSSGKLTFTVADDANGQATITLNLKDNGGTSNGGVDTSAPQSFTITVNPVNDVPSFTKGADMTVLDTAGAQLVFGWATNRNAGPANEAAQAINFIVSNDNNALFASQPNVAPSGDLTFTPAVGASGVATVTLQIHDNGGTANGGVDTSATQTFTITVDKIPVITSANATTFNVGSFGTFSVTASAHPPADIFESGALPTGVTFVNNGPPASSNGTLSGTPATGTGGIYNISFTATNVRGSSAPQAFTLTVNEAPTIGTQPSNVTVCAGANASFTASAATGFPAPTVQWEKSTDGGTTWNPVGGATTTTYSFATGAGNNGEKYRAVFTNGSGSATTNAATLTVDTIPVVATQPATQTVCAGSNVSFTATATSNASDHTVQWYRSTDGGTTFNPIAGATSTTYTFGTVIADNGNKYKARFSDACGTADSNVATLTVDTIPVVNAQPANTTVCAGTNASFTATATSNASDHTVSWERSNDGGTTWTPTGATSTTYSFSTVFADNGAKFRAVFSDACGNTNSNVVTLTVNLAPSVTGNPSNTTVCQAATASFTASASGSPTPAVQWERSNDGGTTWNPIVGATSTTYSLTNAAPADSGAQFRAVFTNVCSTATTTAATLTVNTFPVVTTNPTDQFACAGSSVSFTAAATGTPAPTVQWEKSTDGGTTWNPIGGATSTTYTFNAAFSDNGNKYRAAFTNSCSTVNTTAATLTLNDPPAVTLHPTNQTVCSGTNPTFTATASGSPTPTVQWEKSTDGGTTWNPVAGATSTSFTPTVTIADNGNQYRAVFTNVCASATSNAATLRVDTLPTVNTDPVTQAICAGSPVTFTAAATSNAGQTVQWEKSTDGGTTWNPVVGATSTTYNFNTAIGDNGNKFRAVFSNACGTATTAVATLRVDTLPSVTTQPTNQTVCAGGNASFTVAATSNAGQTVQWEVSTDGGTTWTPTGVTTTTYSFATVAGDNGKQYHAVFSNACGNVTTNAATLRVDTLPTVNTDPVTQAICAGSGVTFTAAATSNAGQTVQWEKSTDGGTTYNPIVGATSTTYSFNTAIGDNGNKFRAVFSNACGTATTAVATLRVDTLPSVTTQPTNQTVCAGANASFTVAATSNAGQTVQWEVSTDGGTTWTPTGVTTTTYTFATVAGDNGKQYHAVFSNACGNVTTNAATLRVDTLPVVSTHPVTQTVCNGATVNLTVVATSNAGQTVQWEKSTDGGTTYNPIVGATSTTLTFNAALTDNGTKYRAVFSNACGNATTNAATLTVDSLPVIGTQPSTQTVCSGGNANFTASSSSNANDETVQWEVSTDGGTTFNPIGGATSTTLTFATSAADNGKQYRAVFTNSCGSTNSNVATLTVDTLPVVNAQPSNSTVCAGSNASFTSTATSNASDHTVQWYVSTDGGTTFNPVPSATSTTYTFATVAGNNGNKFKARFTDACGTTDSNVVTLTVDTLPAMSAQPSDTTVCAGTNASFTATATSNASDHTVMWWRSNDGGSSWVPTGVTSTTYTFATVFADNGAKFEAVFTDACGSTTSNVATLTVNQAPAVTGNPSNTTVCDNTTASFTAGASGSPSPTVQWYLSTDGGTIFNPIVAATSTTYSFNATASMTGYKYRAVFTNVCGNATTTTATLTVNTLPSVTAQPGSQTVTAGQSASFTSTASGTPAPTVQWEKSTDGGTTWNPIGGATSTTYTFTTSKSDDASKYRAVFTNSCGTATSNVASLTVNCSPFTINPSATFPVATYHTAYSQNITVSAGTAPYTIVLANGTNVPSSFTFTDNGNGTATVASANVGTTGVFTFDLTFTDSGGCNETHTYSLTVKPKVVDDVYAASGGTTGTFDTPANTESIAAAAASPTTPYVTYTTGIFANDDAPAGTLTVNPTTYTNANGSITFNASTGGWDFKPTAGFTGTASFTVTVLSNSASVTQNVSIGVSTKVWYVNNTAAGGGDGRSHLPYNTLAAASTASGTGDIIYVHTGSGTTGQNAGITLKANQQLIGAGVALTLNGQPVTNATAGTKPTITNTAATSDVITLAAGNTVKGLTVSGTAGARDGIRGSGVAGFTADTVTISGNVSSGMHFISMTGTVSITNVQASNNGEGLTVGLVGGVAGDGGAAAITLDGTSSIAAGVGQRSVSVQNRPAGAGAITINAPITDSAVGSTGISILNNLSGTIAFAGTVTLTSGGNQAVTLTTNTGTTINFTDLSVTTTTGNGVVASGGGALTITAGLINNTGAATNALSVNGLTFNATFSSINSASATGISLTNTNSGTVTINGGTISGSSGGAIVGSTFGTLNINGMTVTGATASPIVSLTTGTVGGTGFTGGIAGTATGANSAVLLSAVSGTFTVGSAGTISRTGGGAGKGVDIIGGTVAVTYGGPLSQTNGTGAIVSVSGTHTSGAVSFTNTINATSGAGLVFSAANSSYTFSGVLTISGTANGINIGTSTGTFDFSNTSTAISDTTGAGVNITGTTPVIRYAGTIAESVAQRPVAITGVTGGSTAGIASPYSILFSGNITKSNAANPAIGIDISANSGGSFGFTGTNISLTTGTSAGVSAATNTGATITFAAGTLGITTTSGSGFTATGGATAVTVTGSNNSIATTTGTGLNVVNTTVGASGMTWASVGTTGTTGSGINLDTFGNNSVTVNGGTITAGNAVNTRGVDINGGTGTITIASTINTAGTNASTRSVEVSNHTGGTITFSGGVTDGAGGISLATNTGGTITFTGALALTTTVNTGFSATGGGTINAANASNTISTTTGTALNVVSTTVGASGLVFSSIASTGATAAAINLDTIGSNSVTVNGGTITAGNAAGSRAVDINAGNGAITIASTLNTAGTNANTHSVEITNRTGGTVTFSGSVTDNAGGVNLTTNSGATIAFNGNLSLSTGANPAFTATGGGTINLAGAGTKAVNAAAGAGFVLNGVTLNNTNTAVTMAMTGAGTAINVTGGTTAIDGGTTGFNVTNASSGKGLVTAGAGTFTLVGSSGKVAAIAITNGGSGYSSAPSVTISGGGGSGATATAAITNGYVTSITLTAQGSGYTSAPSVSFGGSPTTTATATAYLEGTTSISTATGTAVDVSSTTIGANGLLLKKVAANGAATGMSLIPTAVNGPIVVSGDNTANGGGTIQACTTRGAHLQSVSNLALNNMNISGNGTSVASPNANCADATNIIVGTAGYDPTAANCQNNIHLQSTSGTVVLNKITANSSKQIGINGHLVGGTLILSNLTVNLNGDAVREDGVQLTNTSGTVMVIGGTYKDNAANAFEMQNGSSTPTLNVVGAFFGNTNFPLASGTTPTNATAGAGVFLATASNGGGKITSVVKGSTFDRIYTTAFWCDMANNGAMDATLGGAATGEGNSITNSGLGAKIFGTSSGAVTYSLIKNNFQVNTAVTVGFSTDVITARKGDPSSGTWTGTITQNVIGTSGTSKSGCEVSACNGITVDDIGTTGSHTVTITNNQVFQVNGHGISVAGAKGTNADTGTLRATITGNTVQDPTATSQGNAIFVQAGGVAGDTTTIKAQIDSNNCQGRWSDGGNNSLIRIRDRFTTTTFCLTNYTPTTSYGGQTAGTSASVAAFLTAQNSSSVAPATCTTPAGCTYVIGSATQAASAPAAGSVTGPSCP